MRLLLCSDYRPLKYIVSSGPEFRLDLGSDIKKEVRKLPEIWRVAINTVMLFRLDLLHA